MQLIYIIITILFALVLTIIAKQKFAAFSPARLFTYFWTFQIIFMVLLWHNYLLFSYSGLLFILLCIASFDLGAIVISRHNDYYSVTAKRVCYNERYVVLIYSVVLGISLVGVAYDIIEKGFSLQSLVNLDSFLEMSNQISIDRYSGEEESNGILGNVFSINMYTCPLVGGLLFFSFKKKWFSVLSLAPLYVSGFTQGAKMGIITGSILWLVGVIISIQLFDIKIRLRLKHVFNVLIVVLSFFLILIFTMMFRIGRFDFETFIIACNKFVSYSLGHLPAFDMWFDKIDNRDLDYTLGGKLFYGITNFLGILERKQGVFTEMYVISKGGDATNVFTAFRLIIEDFGLVLTIPFMFIMGLITQGVYHNFQIKKNVVLGIVLMSAIYFFIGWSFVTSIFAYTTYIVMFFYIYIISRFLFIRT